MTWSVSSTQNRSEFTHYGVKGMRWGVRKEYELKGRKSVSRDSFPTPSVSTGSSALDKYNKEHGIKITKTDKAQITIDSLLPSEISTERARVYDKDALALNPVKYVTAEEAQQKFDNLPKTDSTGLTDRDIAIKLNHGNALTDSRQNNCYECTLAYEARRRGYDVQANTCPGGRAMDIFHAFDVTDKIKVTIDPLDGVNLSNKEKAEMCYSEIEKKCLSYGEGARGMLGIQYADYPSGHAMTWLVENGEFKIIDPQHGGRNGKDTFLMCDAGKGVSVCRLDNAEILPGITDYVDPWEIDQDIVSKIKISQHVSQSKLVTKTDIENPVDKYRREQKEKRRSKMGKSAVGRAMLKIGDAAVKAATTAKKYIEKGIKATRNVLKKLFNVQTHNVTVEISHADSHRVWTVTKRVRRGHDDYVQRS